jgi:hypothetical protein
MMHRQRQYTTSKAGHNTQAIITTTLMNGIHRSARLTRNATDNSTLSTFTKPNRH